MANVFGFGPMGALPATSTQQPDDPKKRIEGLARSSKIPANVLMALEEGGVKAEDAATRLASATAAGRNIDEALAEALGNPDAAKQVMSRAYDIADSLYPRQTAPAAPPTTNAEGRPIEANALRDVPASLGASISQGVGSAVRGVGEAIAGAVDQSVKDYVEPGYEALTGKKIEAKPAPNVLSPVAELIGDKGLGGYLEGFVSEEVMREKAELTDPNADLFQPSTWKLGPNPTVRGAVYAAIDVFGSMAPVVVATLVTKSPTVGAAVGGAMAGGDAAKSSEQAIDQMATEKLADGRSRLEVESTVYRRFLQQGLTPAEALDATKRKAAQLSAAYAAIPGALGGAATGKIVMGLEGALAKLPLAGRVAGGAVISGVEEGAQETAEGIAGRTGLNQGVGLDRPVTAGTLNEFVLGALGGAPVGAVSGAFHSGEQPPAPNPGADGSGSRTAPVGGGAPGASTAAGANQPVPPAPSLSQQATPTGPRPPAAPLGPLGATVDVAMGATPAPAGPLQGAAALAPDMTPQPEATPLFPEYKAGAKVRLKDPETQQIIEATFLGESPEGVMVRFNGGELGLEPQEFDSAVQAALMDDEAAKVAVTGKPSDVVAPTFNPATGNVESPLGAAPETPKQETPDAAPANTLPADLPEPAASGEVYGTDANGDGGGSAGALGNLGGPADGPYRDGEPAVSSGGEVAPSDVGQPQPDAALKSGVHYPKRKLGMQYAKADPVVNGIGDASDVALGNVALANAQEGDVLPGVGTVHKVTDKQLQIRKPDGAIARYSVNTDTLQKLAANMGGLIAASANLNDDKLGSLLDMIERDDAMTYQDGVPVLIDDPAVRGERPPRARKGILKPLSPKGNAEPSPEVGEIGGEAGKNPQPDQESTQPPSENSEPNQGVAEGEKPEVTQPRPEGDAGSTQELDEEESAAKEPDPALANAITLQLTTGLGGKINDREAAGLLEAVGFQKPSADEVLNYIVRHARIGNTAQGPDIEMDSKFQSADVSDAMSAWAWVFIVRSGWYPWRGDFRKPSKEFLEFLPAAKAKLSEFEPQKAAEGEPDAAPVTPEEAQPAANPIDEAAAEANPEPTPAQAEAGNYQKGHVPWRGLDLTIENEKGTMRRKVRDDGTVEWEVKMPAHYGYIKRTTGADGEQVDLYFGDNEKSESVWVVDQMDAETGRFDEHKVMLGFDDATVAADAYKAGFSDGKGAARLGGIRKQTIAEFKEWLTNGKMSEPLTPKAKRADAEARKQADTAEQPEPEEAAEDPTAEPEAATPPEPKGPKEKIEDFGEKLGGMRKDAAKNYLAALGMPGEISRMTIGEAFPEPNYVALAAQGTPMEALGLIAALRGSIDRKPHHTKSWRVDSWAEKVEKYRDWAKSLIEGTPVDDIHAEMLKPSTIYARLQITTGAVFGRMEPEDLAEVAGKISVEINHPTKTEHIFGMVKQGSYVTTNGMIATGRYVTEPAKEAVELSSSNLDRLAEFATEIATTIRIARDGRSPEEAKARKVTLELRKYRSNGRVAIFMREPRLTALIDQTFINFTEARTFLDANREELEKLARERLTERPERRGTNRERTGPTWRDGDATKEMFEKELGFRAVAFGESMSQKLRQDRMNETYDAMMDLAGLLGVPPRTLSLNGALGLGFGTHGKGGRGHWGAVFFTSTNPAQDQVIALTTQSGPGALAHEWWHAVDNYLARVDGAKGDQPYRFSKTDDKPMFQTTRYRVEGGLTVDEYGVFKDLSNKLRRSNWAKRMVAIDRQRGKDYYGTTIELAARGFEKMVIDELYKRGMVNDFLVNVNQRSGVYPETLEFQRAGLAEAFGSAMVLIRQKLDAEGKSGPELWDEIPDRIATEIKVGDKWEWAGGFREIVGYDPGLKYFEVDGFSGRNKRMMNADDLAILQAEDAATLTPQGRLEYELAKKAEELADAKRQEREEAEKAKREAEAEAKRKAQEEKDKGENLFVPPPKPAPQPEEEPAVDAIDGDDKPASQGDDADFTDMINDLINEEVQPEEPSPTPEEDFTDMIGDLLDEELGAAETAAPALSPDSAKITAAFVDEFRAGRSFRTIVQARKAASEALGRDVSEDEYLMVEEAIELAVVKRAREIVAAGERSKDGAVAVYGELMDLYNQQPILGERTPEKMRYQAYSTPAPLAYVASRLAGIGPQTRVVEPTAGNGMLVMEADPKNVQANELQASRAAALADVLPEAARTTADAIDMTFRPFDVLITNPPFGKFTDQETQTRKEFPLGVTKTKEIDQAIVWHTLGQMPEDGRAVLIIGGSKRGLDEKGRVASYQERAKSVFFSQLYDTYNVVDHFTVAGELYTRQGAGWPVDVIVIDGKARSSRDYPMKTAPEVLTTWVEVGRKLNDAPDVDTTGRGPADSGDRPAGSQADQGPGGVSEPSGGPNLGNDPASGPRDGAAGDGSTGGVGPSGNGAGPDDGGGNADSARPPRNGGGGRRGPVPDQGGADGDGPRAGGNAGNPDDSGVDGPSLRDGLKSAGANLGGGIVDGIEGLINLFGANDPTKLNSGLNFSKDTYEKAKPFFIAAVQKFGKLGQDIKEILRAVVKAFVDQFRSKGATDAQVRDGIAGMTPYINQFGKDVASGQIDPFAAQESQVSPEPKAPVEKRENTETETEYQVQYTPRSKTAFAVGTLVPKAMQEAVSRALSKIEAEHGDIDAYVAKELGYPLAEILGTEEKPGYFSAEQIDALAMAIKNVSEGKGFINGDQTGVGKGRFVAAMMRYAERKGLLPVFVTQKPGLYADMVRDLRDIGMPKALDQIAVTNVALRADPVPISDETDLFYGPTPSEYKELVAALRKGKLPKGKKFLFTTYDQMRPSKNKLPDRAEALLQAAPKVMFILDESHSAGGDSSGSFTKLKEDEQSTAKFFRQAIQAASDNGAIFASATYAKNPAVMSLYSPTNLSLAVDDINKLGENIEKGGVPLQQVVANQLTADGQYIRRERSFAGVEFGPVEMTTNREHAVTTSRLISDMAGFDREFMAPAREQAMSEYMSQGFLQVGDRSVGVEAASSADFASTVHNLVNQFLLAVKLDSAVDLAIQAWKNGEKPVITLMNVNTSIIADFLQEEGVKLGQEAQIPFSAILERYLERLRIITVETPSKEKIRFRLPDEMLGDQVLDELERLRELIRNMPLQGLTGNPVDAIRDKLEAAGMKVDEITGREVVVRNGIVQKQKFGPSENKRKMNEFNVGKLDALILSASGATGFSLHATAKKKINDGKPRRMIVLQAHPDINVFMQTLGRVHRTGQIVPPKYSLAFSDLAIEKRAAAVLMKKMASLNANTTAGKRSATTLDVTDFVNEVGDRVVAEYVANDKVLAAALGFDDVSTTSVPKEFAKKATGRFIYLHPDEVDQHYEAIEQAYNDRIRELEAAGTNPLEAKTLDLQARTLERAVIKQGKGSGSELDQDLVVERVSVRREGKPLTVDEVRALVEKSLGGATRREWVVKRQDQLTAMLPAHLATLNDLVKVRSDQLAQAQAVVDAARIELAAGEDALKRIKGDPLVKAWDAASRLYKEIYHGDTAKDSGGGDEGKVLGLVERKGRGGYPVMMVELQRKDGTTFDVAREFISVVTEGPRTKGTDEEIKAATLAEGALRRKLDKATSDFNKAFLAVDVAKGRISEERGKLDPITDALRQFANPGQGFKITSGGDEIWAVITDVDFSKLGTNPAAASKIRVNFAVADGMKKMSFPLSQLMNWPPNIALEPQGPDQADTIRAAFESGQTARRETRTMITGNLLEGISQFKSTGQVVLYTTEDGDIRPGILMARNFDMQKELSDADVRFPDVQTAVKFLKKTPEAFLKSEDKVVTLRAEYPNSATTPYVLTVRNERGKGKAYFLLQAIQPLVQSFRQQGKDYRGRVTHDNLINVLQTYSDNLGARWIADAFKDEARAAIGVDLASFESTDKQDDGKESRFLEPVAKLTGEELGAWKDMKELAAKAKEWYRKNLRPDTGRDGRKVTVVNRNTGWEIEFSRKGENETVNASKGEDLLRAVVALPQILESGVLISSKPDRMGRPDIAAMHTIGATVSIAGRNVDLVVLVREYKAQNNAVPKRFQYELAKDNSEGRISSEARQGGAQLRDPALEGALAEINLDFYTPEIKAEGLRPVTADLNRELRKMGLAGKVTPAVVRNLMGKLGVQIAGRATGATVQINEAVADKIGVLRHEVIHILRNAALWGNPQGLFTAEEWRTLVSAARSNGAIMARVAEAYADQSAAVRVEEAVAELFREWAAKKDESGVLGRAMGRIASFFRAMASALRGQGFTDAAMVMERIANGTVGGRGPTGGGGMADSVPQNGAPEMRFGLVSDKVKALTGRKWRTPAQFTENALTDAMDGSDTDGIYSALALVPGRALFSELGKWSFGAKAYLRDKERMDALRNEWHSSSDAVAQDWLKLSRKNPKANKAFMDLLHETTIAGIDPTSNEPWEHPRLAEAVKAVTKYGASAPKLFHTILEEQAEREATYNELRAKFIALPTGYRDMWSRVVSQYDRLATDFESAVTDNIRKGIEVAIKRAERNYRKELQRIADEGLTGDARKRAVADAEGKLAAVRSRGGWNAAARISTLRQTFESNRLKGPYVPLARFGNFFVTIRDEKGKVINFSRFEKKADMDAFVKEQEAQSPGRVQFGAMDNIGDLKAQVDPTFVAEVEGILADTGAEPEVMDAVWQRWLETLPDRSIRTSKIHRKNREGYNKDAFRAFGKHMFHGAHQLARLRYGLGMEEHLNDASEEAEKSADPVRNALVVREMRRRHAFTMNPTGNAVLSSLSGLAFIWYLGATPAAALANVTQTSVVGVPIMAAKWKKAGITGVISELTKAVKDYARGKGHTDKSVNLTDDERRAVQAALKRGTIDKTQAHDLASVAETGIEYNATRERVMRLIGKLFHEAERFNREVTFLANYRLAKKAGMAFGDAVDAGADMTWKIHFDYQNTSRPRIMQNDLGKLLSVFRQYTVNVLWRLFRDTHQAMRGATKEERAEARSQLIGITLSMMAHAGIKGTWGYGLIMVGLGMFFPGGGDDAEKWLHDALLMEGDDSGTAAWNYAMGAALNGVPGHLLRLDLSDRIGMPNLWFRGPSQDLEGQDLYAHYVSELLGPVFGIGEGIFRGVSMAADGEWYRGTEAAVPKVVRDVMKAGRFAVDGATTRNGDPLIEDVSWYQMISQLNGFTPAQLAERYDINNRLKNEEKRVMGTRSDIHRRVGDAIRDGGVVPPKLMKEIETFNAEWPEYPITGDSIKRSYRARAMQSDRNEFGINLNPRLNARLREEEAPSIYN